MVLDNTARTDISDTERSTRCTILVVEDDPDIRDTLAHMLEQIGYSVIAASNGQDALDRVAAASARPNLIILDWMMPVMGGHQFLERHVEDDVLRDVPVLVLSAVDRVFNLSGASIAATMTKPVRMRTLVEVIDRLCGIPRRDTAFLSGRVNGKLLARAPTAPADEEPDRTARTRAPTIAIRRRGATQG